MARIKGLPPTGRATRRPGRMVTKRNRSDDTIVQSWPRPRGPIKSQQQLETATAFALAQYRAAHAWSWEFIEARSQTEGTVWNWRELLVKSAYGNLYEFVDNEGNFNGNWFVMASEIQLLLDTITDEVGALLVRGAGGWRPLLPGPVDYILKTNGPSQLPSWTPPASNPVFWNWFISQCPTRNDIGAASIGTRVAPFWDFTIDQAAFYGTKKPSATYWCSLYRVDSTDHILEIMDDFECTQILNAGTGPSLVPLSAEQTLLRGQRYILAFRQVGLGSSAAFNIGIADQYFSGFPSNYWNDGMRMTKEVPIVGDAFDHPGQSYFCAFRWRRAD